jgi:hypothetical protein
VVVCDDARAPIEARQYCAQTMFEGLSVAALRLECRSALALAGSGRTNGIVVEMEHDGTHVVPVCDGKVLPYVPSLAAFYGAMQGSDPYQHPRLPPNFDASLLSPKPHPESTTKSLNLAALSPSLPPMSLCFELKQPNLKDSKLVNAGYETLHVCGLSTINFLANLLEERAIFFRGVGDRYALPCITGDVGFCSLDFARDMDLTYHYTCIEHWDWSGDHLLKCKLFEKSDLSLDFELPDSQVISFGYERFLPFEPYFHPEIVSDLLLAATEATLPDNKDVMATRFRPKRACDRHVLNRLACDRRSLFSKLPRDVLALIQHEACSPFSGLHEMVRAAVDAACEVQSIRGKSKELMLLLIFFLYFLCCSNGCCCLFCIFF